MLKLIAIVLTVTALMLLDRVDEPWTFGLGLVLCGLALGMAEEYGERHNGPR